VTRRSAFAVATALLALATAAGCRGSATVAAAASSAPACVAPGSAPPSSTGGGTPLPDLRLPCLDGGAPVRLAALGRPAIVNLWASWCGPCRTEMPAIQRYADRAAGTVTVIGVDTGDTAAAGSSVLHDLGVRYPNLFDEDKRLLTAVGRVALPVTLFVDAAGRIRSVYNGQPLSEDSLATLAHDRLGVAP
jgi:thiol-disulfide isomerase/thioredoxin